MAPILKLLKRPLVYSVSCPLCNEPLLNTTDVLFWAHIEKAHPNEKSQNDWAVELWRITQAVSSDGSEKFIDKTCKETSLHENQSANCSEAPYFLKPDFDASFSSSECRSLGGHADSASKRKEVYEGRNCNSRRAQKDRNCLAEVPVLEKQPKARPISQDQLVAEVKGIYAGLVMVESKCIEVDKENSERDAAKNKLSDDQWQALVGLHQTLLDEHHDFFLASQHPSSSSPLRRLASKYAMPARMWRHGIHSFLEVLRHRLPGSIEHMLTFIYKAYSMTALLYETVPAFETTWIECLGDLGRYRMAIEDEEPKDREVWTTVSRHWYSKASDKAPTTGRLYHHLAILARPDALQQLYYYSKSLCVAVPFIATRESILTLFDPVMALPSAEQSKLPPTEFNFVTAHGIMFTEKYIEKLDKSIDAFVAALDGYIARHGRNFSDLGYHMAIANSCAVIGYGREENRIYRSLRGPEIQAMDRDTSGEVSTVAPVHKDSLDQQAEAIKLSNRSDQVVVRRFGDNTLPYLHVRLAFLYNLMYQAEVFNEIIAPDFPWKLTAAYLNALLVIVSSTAAPPEVRQYTLKRIEGDMFPEVVGEDYGGSFDDIAVPGIQRRRPLPEDFAMRGLLWTEKYLPDEYFRYECIDDGEKYFEVASMAEQRRERCLYLGIRISRLGNGRYVRYENGAFTPGPEFDRSEDEL